MRLVREDEMTEAHKLYEATAKDYIEWLLKSTGKDLSEIDQKLLKVSFIQGAWYAHTLGRSMKTDTGEDNAG